MTMAEKAVYWRCREILNARWTKMIRSSDSRWWIVTYHDGEKALCRLVVKKGMLYHGILRQRPLAYWIVKDIRIAF